MGNLTWLDIPMGITPYPSAGGMNAPILLVHQRPLLLRLVILIRPSRSVGSPLSGRPLRRVGVPVGSAV